MNSWPHSHENSIQSAILNFIKSKNFQIKRKAWNNCAYLNYPHPPGNGVLLTYYQLKKPVHLLHGFSFVYPEPKLPFHPEFSKRMGPKGINIIITYSWFLEGEDSHCSFPHLCVSQSHLLRPSLLWFGLGDNSLCYPLSLVLLTLTGKSPTTHIIFTYKRSTGITEWWMCPN